MGWGVRDKGARGLGWGMRMRGGGGAGLRLEGLERWVGVGVGVGLGAGGKEEAKLPATLQCWQS